MYICIYINIYIYRRANGIYIQKSCSIWTVCPCLITDMINIFSVLPRMWRWCNLHMLIHIGVRSGQGLNAWINLLMNSCNVFLKVLIDFILQCWILTTVCPRSSDPIQYSKLIYKMGHYFLTYSTMYISTRICIGSII